MVLCCVDAPGDVKGDVILTWPSSPPMSLQYSGLKTGDRVGVLKTVIGYAVHHFFPPECVLILLDTVSRLHLDVFHLAI